MFGHTSTHSYADFNSKQCVHDFVQQTCIRCRSTNANLWAMIDAGAFEMLLVCRGFTIDAFLKGAA